MRPTNKFIIFLILIAITLFLNAFMVFFQILFYIEIEILFIGLLFEINYFIHFKMLEIKRNLRKFYSIGHIYDIKIDIVSKQKLPFSMEIIDTPPSEILYENSYYEFKLKRKNRHSYTYKILPTKRGIFYFEDIHIRIYTLLGFLSKRIIVKNNNNAIRIFPDLKTVSEYQLLMRTKNLKKIGIKQMKIRGQGTEFESLREYQRDDDYKWIDWKSTAKFGKLISKEFQPEKNQSIYFMLDLGRNLMTKIGNYTKFDYILNTLSLFLYVAHTFNDKIGIIAFSNKIIKHIPQEKQKRNPMFYINNLYDLQPEFVEPDYENAYAFLLSHVKKRSLVVTFTDLHDPQTSEQIINLNAFIRMKHLPLCVSIFDSELIEESEKEIMNYENLLEKIAAQELKDDHLKTVKILQNRGVITVNVSAKKLSIATINEFLKIKTRGIL